MVQLRREKVGRTTPCEGGEGRDRREVVGKRENNMSPTSAKRRASEGRSRRNELAAFTRDREWAVGYGWRRSAPSVCPG